MRADDVRFLFDYSYAATARVLDAAGRLTPEEFVGPASVRGCASLRDLLVHTLDAERGWREGLRSRGEEAPVPLDTAAFPDVPALAGAWRADEERMRAWLAGLDDADLDVPAAARSGGAWRTSSTTGRSTGARPRCCCRTWAGGRASST